MVQATNTTSEATRAASARESWLDVSTTGATIGWFAATYLPIVFLLGANYALDSRTPDTGMAGLGFTIALLVSAFVAFIQGRGLLQSSSWFIWTGIFACLTWIPAMMIATDFGKEEGTFASGFGIVLGLGAYLVSVAIIAIVGAIVWSNSARAGRAWVLSSGLGLALGIVGTCAFILVTLPVQAEAAIAANEAPAPVAALFLVLLLFLAKRHQAKELP